MSAEIVTLRLLHIIFGAIWVGGAFVMAVVIEPKLRKLGPPVQLPFLKNVMPPFIHTMLGSATVTIVVGIVLVLRLRSGSLSTVLDSGWGWAILIGFVTAIIAFVIGLSRVLPTSRRMISLADSFAGRASTEEESGRMQALESTLRLSSRLVLVLVLIAIGAMAAARYV